jgi:AAA domain
MSEDAKLSLLPGGAKRRPDPSSLSASDLAEPLGPKRWISEGLTMQAGGRPIVFCGPGGSRKSWFAMAMQICGAIGEPLLGFRFKATLRSIYLDWEQTPEVSRERYQLLAKGYGVDLRELDLYVRYAWQPIVSLAPRDDRSREDAVSDLCRLTERQDLAIVDSIFSASGCVLENTGDASIPFRVMTSATVRTGASFVGLDHSGKPPASGSPADLAFLQRGHSSKLQATQTMLAMVSGKGQPTIVSCQRSQGVEERLWPKDFRFTVAAKNGGCVLLPVAGMAPIAFSDEAITDAKRRLLACVRANPGLSGNSLIERVEGKRTLLQAAIGELRQEAQITNRGGSEARPLWVLTQRGTQPRKLRKA